MLVKKYRKGMYREHKYEQERKSEAQRTDTGTQKRAGGTKWEFAIQREREKASMSTKNEGMSYLLF